MVEARQVSGIRLLWHLIRNFPRLLALRLEQTVRALHAPEVIDGQHVCLRCQMPAPCPTYMNSVERTATVKAGLR